MKKIMGKKWMVLLTCLMALGILAGSKGVASAESKLEDFVMIDNGSKLIGYSGNGGEIEIPEKVNVIKEGAFKGNEKITKVTFPKGMEYIEAGAFEGCKQLKEVSLGAGLKNIESRAFYGCSELTEVTIPALVEYIGTQTFSHCPKLLEFKVEEGSRFYNALDGVLFRKGDWIVAYPGGKKGDYIVPENALEGSYYAFEGSVGLTGITLTKQGEYIAQGLFKDCVNLSRVTFSEGVTHIGMNAFEGCTGLTEIQMPNTLRYIEKEGFKGCSELSRVDFQSRMTSIGEGAFSGCTKLTTFTVDKANTKYSAKDGVLYNKKQTEVLLYPAGKTGNVTFAPTVKAIGEGAFQGCNNLSGISIPDTITKIGVGAFKDCIGLSKVQMSEALTVISRSTFENCIGLTTVEISGYVNRIDRRAFKGCENIKKMVIPESVAYIHPNAFEDCDKLTIYGDDKSYAQRYAKGHSFGFMETITKPAKIRLKVKSPSKKAIKLSWEKAAKAKGYIVQISTRKKGGFKTIGLIKSGRKVNFNKSGLKSGKTYYIRARSYKTVNKKTYYGKYSDVISVKVK